MNFIATFLVAEEKRAIYVEKSNAALGQKRSLFPAVTTTVRFIYFCYIHIYKQKFDFR